MQSSIGEELINKNRISELASGARVFHGDALDTAAELLREIELVVAVSPLRSVVTPGGKSMSVEMTNCGTRGWVSDRRGYRYEEIDPITGKRWPVMPPGFEAIAKQSAARAGFANYAPNVCLINRYAPGASMGLHQDKDERDFLQPIVSVSLGLSIGFKIGGPTRGGPTTRVDLVHGDVLVFGGPARLAFHGVNKLREGEHPLTGNFRFNLTFRVS